NLVKRDVLALHFAVDGVDMFGPAGHRRLKPKFINPGLELTGSSVNFTVPFGLVFVNLTRNIEIKPRLHIAEGQIFELPLYLPDTETVCQGRIYRNGFVGDLQALFGR